MWIIYFLDVYVFTPLNHLLSKLSIGSVSDAKIVLHAMKKQFHDATADIAYSEQWQRHEL